MRRGREIWRGVGRIGIGTVGFLLAFFLVHLPHGPEHWSADLCTALLSDQLKGQHPRIAIVEVDEQTLRESNYLSPVDRSTLAAIVRGLIEADVKVIGLDFVFDRHTEDAKDKELLNVIKGSSVPIVLGALDEPSAENQAFESAFLAVASRPIGHLYYGEHHNPAVITDQVIREMADPREYPGRQSFAELVARAAGTYRPPASLVISWLRPPKDGRETFLTLSGQDVLGGGLKESVAAEGDARWQDRSGRRQFYRSRPTSHAVLRAAQRLVSRNLSVHAQIVAQLSDANRRPILMLRVGWAGFFWSRLRLLVGLRLDDRHG